MLLVHPRCKPINSIINPLILTAAKTAWQFWWNISNESIVEKNIWRGNVNQNITYNSPSNILQDLFQFKSYCQKYYRSRRQFPEDLLCINGIIYRHKQTWSYNHTYTPWPLPSIFDEDDILGNDWGFLKISHTWTFLLLTNVPLKRLAPRIGENTKSFKLASGKNIIFRQDDYFCEIYTVTHNTNLFIIIRN